MKLLFLYLTLMLSPGALYVLGQTCTVSLASLAGTYTGDCKKGKADGNGTATGTDKYTGEFKAGLPDGKGTYEWSNGDKYEGDWVKGLRDGNGTMMLRGDSIITGVWKKGTYAGAKPVSPYTVFNKSNTFSRIDFRKNTNSTESTIEIIASSVAGGTFGVAGTPFLPAVISDVSILKGSFARTMTGNPHTRGMTKKLLNVTFPFRAVIVISEQDLDIEITEPGNWTLTLLINK